MKKLFKTSLLLLFVQSAICQTINITEPEYTNNAVYVNDTIGIGIPLEKQKYTIKSGANAAAYIPIVGLAAGKATSKVVFQGNESTVKISKTEKIRFIVKMFDNSNDPTTTIEVFKLTKEKKTRTFITAEARTIGGSESKNLDTFNYVAKKYGQSSYLIELNNLEIGQYGIHLTTSTEYLLFDIY